MEGKPNLGVMHEMACEAARHIQTNRVSIFCLLTSKKSNEPLKN